MNTLTTGNYLLNGSSYDDPEGFRCGNEFNDLAALIAWLIHRGGGPIGGGDGGEPRPIVGELTQVAAGLREFVASRGFESGALRAQAGAEGLKRAAGALGALQRGSAQA